MTAVTAITGILVAALAMQLMPGDAHAAPRRKPKPTPTPTPTVVPTPTPTPGPGTAGTWESVTTGSVGRPVEVLRDVAVGSGTVAWAVGTTSEANGSGDRTLVQRWDGTRWSIVSSPDPDPARNELHGVDAAGEALAWAVGVRGGANGPDWQPLIARFQGGSWSSVSAPALGSPSTGELFAVDVVDATTAFAVGATSSPATDWFDRPLIVRWDGATWTRMTVPSFASTSVLYGVAARSATDVWAVGRILESNWRTLILHWDGHAWSRVASPNDGTAGNVLNDVATVVGGTAWAVGSSSNGGRTLIVRWVGSRWRQVSSPQSDVPYTTQSSLAEVAATAPDDAWAVGVGIRPYTAGCDCYSPPAIYTLVQHWDGTRWSVVDSPDPSTAARPQSSLAAVAQGPNGPPLAVGDQLVSSGARRSLGLVYRE